MHRRSGFTLIELLIYSAVFGTVSLTLVYFLTTFFRVSGYQASSAGVANQANFILQQIERQVANAGFLVVNDTGDDEADGIKSQPHAKLVIKDRAEGSALSDDAASPILIWRDAATSNAMMKQGNRAATALNNASVAVTGLTFTKVSAANSKDVVLINLVLAYQSTNPAERISREFTMGVGKASAATFDTGLTPATSTANDIGASGTKWASIWLSQDANVDGKIVWNAASTTAGTPPATNGSIAFLKQGLMNVAYPTLAGGALATVIVSTTSTPGIADLQGVQSGNRIFMTPPEGLNDGIQFMGATAKKDAVWVKVRNITGTSITGTSNNWSYLIMR